MLLLHCIVELSIIIIIIIVIEIPSLIFSLFFSHSYVTVSMVIPLARGLQRMVADFAVRRDPAGAESDPLSADVRRMVDILHNQMAERFTKIEYQPLLFGASLLDPRIRKGAFYRNAAAAENACHKIALEAAKVTFPREQADVAELGEAAQGQSTQQSSFASLLGDVHRNNSAHVTYRSLPSDGRLEVTSFLQEGPLDVESGNPLTWWKERQLSFPRLCKVMKTKLCIVATSVPSERIFSKTGLLISERRNRLKGDKVSQLVFLNANKL